jgi:hypothetical protein
MGIVYRNLHAQISVYQKFRVVWPFFELCESLQTLAPKTSTKEGTPIGIS